MKDITQSLPRVIADHITAHNKPEPEAFLDTFASDAIVNDAQREFLGRDAIRSWAEKEIFGDHVTMQVQEAWEHPSGVVVRAKYEGDFDKTGLPDPLILTNYFVLRDDRISQLIILLNRPSGSPQRPER